MKQFIGILLAVLLTVSGVDGYAQKKNSENDYNLKKAYEVLREERDEAKALELVNKQLDETPDNIDALLLKTQLLQRKEEYGLALSTINHAMKVNKPKKSGTSNALLHWWKAALYKDVNDIEKAIDEYSFAYKLAKKEDKENLQSISFDYASALFRAKKLDEADVIYKNMLAEDEADVAAMVGLARNHIERKDYQEALSLMESAHRLDKDYEEIYRFMMQAYDGLGESSKAIDSALDWFNKTEDPDENRIMDVLKKKTNYTILCIKDRMKKSENPYKWKVLLTCVYEQSYQYAQAIKMYDEIESEYGHYDFINRDRSECYSRLGLYDKAISDISNLIEKKPGFLLSLYRADYYRLSGRYEEAIKDLTDAIDEKPLFYFTYYRRGWCYELMGDKEKAMADYNQGIELDDTYSYLFLMRGELYQFSGEEEKAKADFNRVLQLDTLVDDNSCRQYALHFLGQDKEAEEWMDKIIALDPQDAGNYYDQACLYSRMGRLEDAVKALKSAFEKGYRAFAHIEHDDDLDAIRELPSFKALFEEYKAKHEAYLKENEIESPSGEESITEVAIKRNPGGTFEIPCDINGLPLQMIFDTGASDVTISSVEANFMFKNGYLAEKDIKGKRYYQVANGQINEGTVITLRKVKIGDAVLRNVDASVVKNQQAPLLLGQSVMERFGTITIDNQNNKLIIKN